MQLPLERILPGWQLEHWLVADPVQVAQAALQLTQPVAASKNWFEVHWTHRLPLVVFWYPPWQVVHAVREAQIWQLVTQIWQLSLLGL